VGDGLNAVGVGLQSLQVAGVPVDRAKVCAEAGIPVEEGVEFREYEPPQAPQPPGNGKDGTEDPEADDGEDDGKAQALSSLPLSTRADQALIMAGLRMDSSLCELVQKTKAQMLSVPGVGKKAVKEIEQALAELGLRFGMDADEYAATRNVLAARRAESRTREILASGRLGRRARAPFQGQAFVDELAANGRSAAAKLLAGDVRALRRVVMEAKAGPDGKIDAAALKAEILRVYRDMKPDQLARVMANCRLLAELSGRYAVVKEVVSK